MSDWYYLENGAQKGPISDEQLLTAVGDGKITAADMVWADGMEDWAPVSTVVDFDGDEEDPEPESEVAVASVAAAPAASVAPVASVASSQSADEGAEWYYMAGGEQQGPVGLAELGALFKDRTISSQDLVWTAALGDWTQAGSVDTLSSFKPVGLAAPPSGATATPATKKKTAAGTKRKKTVIVKKKTGGTSVTRTSGKSIVSKSTAGAAASSRESVNPYVAPAATDTGASEKWQYPGMKWLLGSFSGRIPRSKFWIGYLTVFATVLFLVYPLIGFIIFLAAKAEASGQGMSGGTIAILAVLGIIALIFFVLANIWALAVYAKRWHDRGKSGWWSLILLIPYVGGLWLLVELGFLKGNSGPNQYGADPLGGVS